MEVMFASHSWPRWGNARIQEVLRAQRDLYANMNNQVLHLANQGVTVNEIHNVYRSPPSLQKQWVARSYHGSEEINSRGIINRFIGYWDGNPTTLIPLSPREVAPLYVEMMGGGTKIMSKGHELIDQGKYLEANEILNRLVFAKPGNQAARDLLADAFEQIAIPAQKLGSGISGELDRLIAELGTHPVAGRTRAWLKTVHSSARTETGRGGRRPIRTESR
jgi:alkyl sulfatase BDS1-like metallo-beta-lactamase superfamily hydrolase